MKSFGVLAWLLAAGLAATQQAVAEEIASDASPDAIEQVASEAVEAVAEETASNEVAEPARAPDTNKKICKYEKMTGTRFGRKVCMSQAECDQLRKDSQEGVRSAQRKNSDPGTGQ